MCARTQSAIIQNIKDVLEHKTQKTNQKRIRKGETIMVNVGIIGAGRIGQVHMNSILTRVPNAKIKAVADPFLSEEADKKARQLEQSIQQKITKIS